LNIRGFTLLELLFVISLTALLSAMIVSGGYYLFSQQKQRLMIGTLRQSLAFAKQAAMAQGEAVSLCAAASDQTCGDNWAQGILIFLDPHSTGQMQTDTLLIRVPPLLQTAQIVWKGFLPFPYIRFAADGLPHGYHGSFYVLHGHTQQVVLVINSLGRVR